MALPDAGPAPLAPAPWVEERGAKIRITAVRTFLTAPHGCPHLIVRVETNDPGLYGLGCASDPQRTLAVRSVLDDYLAPMLPAGTPTTSRTSTGCCSTAPTGAAVRSPATRSAGSTSPCGT